jgi:hypothetical protein
VRRALLGLLVLLFACKRHEGAGSGSLAGTVNGSAIPYQDVVGLSTTVGGGQSVSADFVDVPHMCTESPERRVIGEPSNLTAMVSNRAGSVSPGTYPILDALHAPPAGGGAPHASVYLSKLSTSGAAAGASMVNASSGSVTLTIVTDKRIVGTFEATFVAGKLGATSGGTLRGSFDAPICPIPK